MAVPTNKEELLKAINIQYEKLKKELLNIPAELREIKDLEGHTKGSWMSIHDLLAYIVGWGALVLKWHYKKDRNEAIDFPETGYKWNELGKLAQKFYADYREEEFALLLKKSDEINARIQLLVTNTSNQALYEQSWYEQWTLGRMIQFNTASPYANARARIRKWKKAQTSNE